ncbi:MAG: sensor histidine kinase [Candidatus Binatia bacterium]
MIFQPYLDVTQVFSDAIILLSGRGVILGGNSAAHELFSVKKLAGLQFSDLVSDPREKIARTLMLWSGNGRMMPAVFELRQAPAEAGIRCDGAVITPATAEDPPLLAVRCALRSQVSATDLLVRLNERIEVLTRLLAEQRIREQERVAYWETSAAVFAHEFGNPLNAISTSLQLVKLDLADSIRDPGIRATLLDLSQEIERLSSLLREFRSFARPQSLELRSADLAKSVRETLAPELRAYGAAGVHVDFEFGNALPGVMIDHDRLKQALLNVCKNAVEAMPEGGRLLLKAYRDEDAVVLEAIDSGVGIPEGMDVFQLFKTTKLKGSGLGLPITRQIISAHHGTIDLVNNAGQGATCRIRLPAQMSALSPASQEAQLAPVGSKV